MENVAKLERSSTCNVIDDACISWKYAKYLLDVLLTIKRNTNLDCDVKEELISANNVNLFAKAVLSAAVFGLSPYVYPGLQTVMKKVHSINKITDVKDNMAAVNQKRLAEILVVLHELLHIKVIACRNDLQFVIIELIAGLFTMISALKTNEPKSNNDIKKYELMLTNLYDNSICSREMYFKYLLLIKGFKGSPTSFYSITHRELMLQLKTPGGFVIFCRTLLSRQDKQPAWEHYNILTKILTAKGHNSNFYSFIVDEALEYFEYCLYAENEQRYVPACLVVLKEFHSYSEYQQIEKIEKYFTSNLQLMISPNITLTGTILLESKELKALIFRIYNAFTNTMGAPLNTNMLIPYFHVLLIMYSQTDSENVLNSQLSAILISLLGQRMKTELKGILKGILYEEKSGVISMMHPSVYLRLEDSTNSYTVQINNKTNYNDNSNSLIQILKKSNNNLLIYNIFMELLNILEEANEISTKSKSDLLESHIEDEDIAGLLSKKFFKRYIIIETLSNLINYKNFHSQFRDNRRDLVEFIKSVLIKRMNPKFADEENEVVIIVLTLFRELQQYLDVSEVETELLNLFNEYKQGNRNADVQKQIELIFQQFDNFNRNSSISNSTYKMAIDMFEHSEAFCKVFGSTQLIKLIKEADEETLANKHTILALAMSNLKDTESYAYLNTVKLLVVLSNILESVIMESLIIEFKNGDLDIEYRLKIGEVLVEVVKHLGALAYKYKDSLLQSFLLNCTNCVNEFRTSCLSNLASLCSILLYQVQSNFQEVYIHIHLNIMFFLNCTFNYSCY